MVLTTKDILMQILPKSSISYLKQKILSLGLKMGKKRYVDAVTALSKAFAIAVPHPEAMKVKEEVAFFSSCKIKAYKI